METQRRRLSTGNYVDLTYEDDTTGYISFAGDQYPGHPVRDPGTYHYDHGGTLYREACDMYRAEYD